MGMEAPLSRNIFITGATGFVGTALLKRLLREDVRLFAAVRDAQAAADLPPAADRIVVEPLSDSSDYSSALRNMDVVIHLAARVHVMQDRAADPLQEFRRVNVAGTERLARQAVRSGVKRFVFISTVKVHGEETATPYREHDRVSPLDPYGVSKAEAESALRGLAGETGLEVVVVRPPLVYGPGVKANLLQLMSAVARGIPLPFGSIRNRRSIVYVGNLVDALVLCALHPAAAGKTYLVSDGEDVSTPELIERMAAALGRSHRLFPCPAGLMRAAGRLTGRSSAVERLLGSLQVDGSRIERELGWKRPFTMKQGLQETADWYRARH